MDITAERLKDLIIEVDTQIHQNIRTAWKEHRLNDFLKSIGMEELIPKEVATFWEDSIKNGKIIIFGELRIKEREIMACMKNENISKDRVEIHLGYDELKRYNFERLRYNNNYRLILFGAVPHSVKDKGEYSSIIARMEQTDGYTKVIRLCSNEQLKITKSNLKKVIHDEIASGYLAA